MGLRRRTADENLRLEPSLTCTAPCGAPQVQVLGGFVALPPAKASIPAQRGLLSRRLTWHSA